MSLEFTLSSPEPSTTAAEDKVHDVVIIGSGPAGFAAALYTSRAHLDTIVITGHELGGQVAATWEVDNYPGFPDGVTGPELVEKMQKHAERFGARFEMDQITAIDLSKRPFTLTGNVGTYAAKAVIVATGASPRKLNVPGEKELTGRGVSYCATCDGYFFQDKEIAVVGGGDSALEEALFLTRYAQVTIIHRRDELRAGPTMQKRARENEKIRFVWDSVVEEIIGDTAVRAVRLRNVKTGELSDLTVDGAFIVIGHPPNTQLFAGQLEMDQRGYLETDRRMRSNVQGVWVAGEAGDPDFRQVITSAGMGAAAAIEAQRWLAGQE
ncbi:MAG: thioredoxin-disulfide reductase [Ardenticatenales bacterium]|nr:thioredoxin-disulfide reductase [Ardenticatenales bacterium]